MGNRVVVGIGILPLVAMQYTLLHLAKSRVSICLEVINFSQLSVHPAAKISHFEIMCRVLGHQPSLDTFFVLSIFLLWYNDISVKKDPLPSDDLVDLPLLDKLNDNRTLIRKYPETFLCLVGLSRSFVDMDVRPTLLGCDKSSGYIGLLDFMKSVDSFKVKTRERTLADGEVPLLIENADMVVAPLDNIIRLVSHTIADDIKEYSGKNKMSVGFSNVSSPVKKDSTGGVRIDDPVATTAGKSPHDYDDELISTHNDNVRTCPRSDRYVVLSSSSMDTDILTSPQVAPPVPSLHADADIVATDPVVKTGDSSIPRTVVREPPILRNETGNSSAAPDHGSPIDDFYDSQTIDSVTAHNIYASLCNRHDSNFLDLLNVNSAQHSCMVSELRLRYEHEITVREKFEQKFLKSFEAVQQRDVEIVVLKTKLEKAKSEAVGVVKLRRRVSELEAAVAAKADELAGLSVVELESECERLWGQVKGETKLKERFMAMQDAEVQRLVDRGSALDVRLSELSYQVDSEIYPHMLTVVAGHRLFLWLLTEAFSNRGIRSGEVKHGKLVGRLSSFSGSWILIVIRRCPLGVVFMASPLDEGFLYVRRDSLISGPSSSLVITEVATSGPDDSSLATTVTLLNTLAIANYQISSLAVVDTTVSTAEPHDDLFDATVLDKPVDS
ncbi:hypothetical protein Tco_0252070 [Tanacetum coccineum]